MSFTLDGRAGGSAKCDEYCTCNKHSTVMTYSGVHQKLISVRGHPSKHICQIDECVEQAKHWAYLYNGDPELTDEYGKKYSEDILECYATMCHPHHIAWDNQHDPDRMTRGRQKCEPDCLCGKHFSKRRR